MTDPKLEDVATHPERDGTCLGFRRAEENPTVYGIGAQPRPPGEAAPTTNMIDVKVEFLGTFSSEIGELNREVALRDGATIGDLVRHLIQNLDKGERFQKMVLDEEGNKRSYVLLMMNYEHLYREPLEVKIPDKAKVVFAMPCAGG